MFEQHDVGKSGRNRPVFWAAVIGIIVFFGMAGSGFDGLMPIIGGAIGAAAGYFFTRR